MISIDYDTLKHTDFDKARSFLWQPQTGAAARLDTLDDTHLRNLQGFLERWLDKLRRAEEEFEMSKIDPQVDPGFSGLEEPTERAREALRNVLIEVKRRSIAQGNARNCAAE
jgi:hypothetical protein